MTFSATILKVLIASPADTAELRDAVEQALHEWNGDRGEKAAAILLPRRWETNAVPELSGADGQTVINRQLVSDADVVIGIFHATLGRKTPRAASGTAEELGAVHDAGKPVHVFFSSMPIARDHDRSALADLDEFKEEITSLGLYGTFDTPGSLKEQVKRAIEHDLAGLQLPASRTDSGSARLRAEYAYEREPNNRGRMTTRRERLIIVNDGSAVAEKLKFQLTPIGDLEAPRVLNDVEAITLPPGGTFAVPLLTHAGIADAVEIVFEWTEDGGPRESTQTLSLF